MDHINILYIEDNAHDVWLINDMLTQSLKNLQYTLVHAKNLHEGIKQLKTRKFSIVLLDLNLPDSGGIQTFSTVYSTVPDIPIIVVTGVDDNRINTAIISEGAQDCLHKGQVDKNHLTNSINFAIERKKQDEIRYSGMLEQIKTDFINYFKTKDRNIVDELINRTDQLFELAERRKDLWLIVETYLIYSKLSLIDLDFEKALHFLLKGGSITEKYGLTELVSRISHEQDRLLSYMNDWNYIIGNSDPLSKLTQIRSFKDQIDNMIVRSLNEKLEFCEEIPIMVLITTAAGITLYSRQFSSNGSVDAVLIGSYLATIDSAIREAFTASGSIERIKFNDITIVLKQIKTVLFCYVFKGESYLAPQKLNNFIQDVQNLPSIKNMLDNLKKGFHRLSEPDFIALEEGIRKNILLKRI